MGKKQIYMTEYDHKRLAGIIRSYRDSGNKKRHLQALETELERAVIVPASLIPQSLVTMNSTVRFTDLESGKQNQYTLVFPGQADAGVNRISILAPIGAALIGENEGSEVEYEAPGGIMKLRVEHVVYQPEAEGAAIL
jgi:regulator of nucleoside diphosphate kinase